MAVYTTVSFNQLSRFLQNYELGTLECFEGISAGITNSNYKIETTTGRFILTLYEHLDSADLNYILGLQHHLYGQDVRCAAAIKDNNGAFFSVLNQRPAAIINFIQGNVCYQPSENHCTQIGEELARYHLAGDSYSGVRPNPRGLDWCLKTADQLYQYLNNDDRDLIKSVTDTVQSLPLSNLHEGALHADLFHDNVLFDEDSLAGIIDFDYACVGFLIYDIAVTANDCCINNDGHINALKLDCLIKGYRSVRILSEEENKAFPAMLKMAALRFWLSRLFDQLFPLEGELTFVKDPDEIRKILVLRCNSSISI